MGGERTNTSNQPIKQASVSDSSKTIAYITEAYPGTTFIDREISNLVQVGCPIIVLALKRPDFHSNGVSNTHPMVTVEYAEDQLLWTPRVWYAHLVLFCLSPIRYFLTLIELARHTFRSGWMLPRAIYAFVKAVYLARAIRGCNVRHAHAFYAGRTADVAWIISRLTDITYSFTGISHDIEGSYPFLEHKLACARFVVTASERILQIAREKSRVKDQARFHVIHTGVDPTRFCPGKSSDDKDPLIVSVTRLIPSKGLDVLVDACALLRDRGVVFFCRIVGTGPQQRELEQLINVHQLRGIVELVGFHDEAEVIACLQSSQVFALPCRDVPAGTQDGIPSQFVTAIRDDIPVSLIEAMSVGLPVVATDQSSIPELIDDQVNGFLVPPGDPSALASALELLLSNPALRRRLGSMARDQVRREFDGLECARQLSALFAGSM